ncbi:protein phosphatase 2C domain-containing protein [Nocardia sp. NPDC046763]|uniref:protein phosphatase 2C domain-containing protein n=1 Tax=Nocardia sp. NPDC046763 TaxID=3155256 RepID=UPI0033C82191
MWSKAKRDRGTPSLREPEAQSPNPAVDVVPRTNLVPRADPPESMGWLSSRPIIVGDPTPEFEPSAVSNGYRRTPYRPDTVIDGWSHGGFTIRAASLRGHLHRYNGAPRQDDLAITVPGDRGRLAIAVADGVSAARHSHIGSTAAVRYATQWLESEATGELSDIAWRSLFENTAWTLIEHAATVLSTPDTDAAQAELALATTLTCVVCEANNDGTLSAVIAGVGDSGAWLLSDGVFHPVWGGKEPTDAGLTSSAVSGLPRVPDDIRPVELVIWPGDVLLVGTDGFGDPLGGGTGVVGGLFRDTLAHRVPAPIEFAHVLDFSRETFDDDRTLVAVWPSGG